MTDFLSIAVRGNTEIARMLEQLPPRAAAAGVETATDLINDRMNRYAASAPYNYVPYSAVGGFFSPRQRAFVMAGIRNGTITTPYARSGGDHYHTEGSGVAKRVVSDKVSMFFSMADQGQARLQALRGWGTVGELLQANNEDIVKAFELGVQDAIRMLNAEFSETMASVAP